MRQVSPKVELLAETKVDHEALRRYLDDIGAEEYEIDESLPGADQLTIIAGKACYKSFVPGLNPNVTKVRDDSEEYIQNIHAVGHGSVTEHPSVTFIFWNVSRVFTHELVRHRVGVAMSQESLRYVRLTDLGMWLPTCISENKEAVQLFQETVEYLEEKQRALAELYDIENMKNFKQKKILTSAFRRIAPIGLATAIVWSMNMRAARHIIQMRTSRHAEEEIRLVFNRVAEILKEKNSNMFADFTCEEVDGLMEWTTPNASMPYDGEKIRNLEKRIDSWK